MDGRDARAGGHEAAAQIGKVGEFAGIEDGVECAGEIGFDALVVGEREQADHGPTRVTSRPDGAERFPRSPVRWSRPQRVTVAEPGECAWFGAQRGDDMSIVDDVGGGAPRLFRRRPAARQRHHQCRTQECLDALVMDAQMQVMPDEA
jgi:hypothetical protein